MVKHTERLGIDYLAPRGEMGGGEWTRGGEWKGGGGSGRGGACSIVGYISTLNETGDRMQRVGYLFQTG